MIAHSYVDQQQESKKRRDVIAREERGLEKCKAEEARHCFKGIEVVRGDVAKYAGMG